MMKTPHFKASGAWGMRGMPVSLYSWPAEPDSGSEVVKTNVDSGRSLRGKPRFRARRIEQNKTKPFSPALFLKQDCAAKQPQPALPYIVITVPWDCENTKPQSHYDNGFEAWWHTTPQAARPQPVWSESERRSCHSWQLGLSLFQARSARGGATLTPMSIPRPYTQKERFKNGKKTRQNQPDYNPQRECHDHWQDHLDNDLSLEAEQRSMRRRGMDPDFAWSSSHLRMTKAIRQNVNQGIQVGGRDHTLFFTLTFGEIPSGSSPFRNASACFRKASKAFFPVHFNRWCRVMDVHRDGRPHFHGIAITHQPVYDGFDPEAYDSYMAASKEGADLSKLRQLRDKVSTNSNLRFLWSEMDANLERFGFGPLHGFFPIRHFPAASADVPRSRVAEYMVRSYLRIIPALKAAGEKGTRAAQTSFHYPLKTRAKDIVSNWWLKSLKPLMEVFGFDEPRQFGDLIGPSWGLAILNIIDGLDSCTFKNGLNQGWREFPLNDKSWLARRLIEMIEHDRLLFAQSSGLLEELRHCSENYLPHPDEPGWRWVPVFPTECTCGPGSNLTNSSVVHSIMALPS